MEEARSALIQTIEFYNQGVSNCSVYGDEIIYVCLFLTILVLNFKDKRAFYEVFIELVGLTALSWIIVWLVIWILRSSNSPHTIYMVPSMAVRHGCAYDRTPIRINPLFEDKDLFARIYKEAGNSEYKACVGAISTLKTMAIEYIATRNCTC